MPLRPPKRSAMVCQSGTDDDNTRQTKSGKGSCGGLPPGGGMGGVGSNPSELGPSFQGSGVPHSDELQNSSVLLSYKIPAADQDVDALTLSEMLTEAYRGQVDYSVREGVSVSQSSSSLSDRTGQPVGDRSGQPGEHKSSEAQIRTLLDEQRQTVLAECHARVSQSSRTPSSSSRRRALTLSRTIMATEIGIS